MGQGWREEKRDMHGTGSRGHQTKAQQASARSVWPDVVLQGRKGRTAERPRPHPHPPIRNAVAWDGAPRHSRPTYHVCTSCVLWALADGPARSVTSPGARGGGGEGTHETTARRYVADRGAGGEAVSRAATASGTPHIVALSDQGSAGRQTIAGARPPWNTAIHNAHSPLDAHRGRRKKKKKRKKKAYGWRP